LSPRLSESRTHSALDSLLEFAPCGFVSFNDDGTIREVNALLCEMVGLTRDEITGTRFESILNVGSRIFYQTHFFPLLKLQGHAEEIFLLLRSAGGEDVAVLCNAARRERNGEWVTDCILLRVRERQKFEEALVRAKQEAEAANAHLQEVNRAKSAFLATMSHELRTPLNAIGGYVQLLEMGVHGPITEAQGGALERIARAQRHLLRLINDLLNLARIEAGRVEYKLEPCALQEVVDAVMPMVEPQLESRRIRRHVEIPAGLTAHADRDKTQQILLNLLSNSTKFTPAEGSVTIEALDDGSRVHLRVRDTGVGIPPERLAHVFEPFVQVDESHARRSEGTGLGLAISRDLAHGMHGDLTAESTPGVGSVFTLTLPRRATDDTAH
jgi:PAS domain S-box-containing protein